MQKIIKQFFTEFIWLTVSFGLSILFLLLVFGSNPLTDTIDIHLYDTYFVIAPPGMLIPIFFVVTFIVYFIKEFRNSFRRTLPNWILIIIGATIVLRLTFLIKTFSQLFTAGGTLYPPLSALRADNDQDPMVTLMTSFFAVIQMLVLIMLLFVAFRWGTQKPKKRCCGKLKLKLR